MTRGHVAPSAGTDGQQTVLPSVLGKGDGLVPFGTFVPLVAVGIKEGEHVRQLDFRTQDVAGLGAADDRQICRQFLSIDLAVAVGIAAGQDLIKLGQPDAVLRLATRPARGHEQAAVADGWRAGRRREHADVPLLGAVGQPESRQPTELCRTTSSVPSLFQTTGVA